MLGQDIIVAPTQSRPPALIDGSGRKARDRIEHFLRAAIDNDNTRRAHGRALGSFFAFLEDGGKQRIQDIGPLDVRDYLEAAKANGLSTATLKQHMAAIRMLFNHMVTGAVLEHNPALSVKAPKLGKGKTPVLTAEEAGAAAPRSPPTWRTRHAGEGAAIAAHASTRTPQLYDRR
jgi:site-specific recombinase XerD